MFRPLSYVHISEHGHLGTYLWDEGNRKSGRGWGGWEECSLWNNELITLLTSGGGKKKRCAVPRLTCGTLPQASPTCSVCALGRVPSGGGDRYLHHPVWSEELMFRCQSVCWVAQASSSFLGPCCGVLVQIPSNPCDY